MICKDDLLEIFYKSGRYVVVDRFTDNGGNRMWVIVPFLDTASKTPLQVLVSDVQGVDC